MKNSTWKTKWRVVAGASLFVALSALMAFVLSGVWALAAVSFVALISFGAARLALQEVERAEIRGESAYVLFIRDRAEDLSIARARGGREREVVSA